MPRPALQAVLVGSITLLYSMVALLHGWYAATSPCTLFDYCPRLDHSLNGHVAKSLNSFLGRLPYLGQYLTDIVQRRAYAMRVTWLQK